MNNEKTFALLIDVDNLPLTADGVQSIINQVKNKGEIAYGKVYGYSEKKQHKGILDIVHRLGFDFTSKSRSKKSSKSMIDNRMFIDAVEIACINENIDSICVVAGDGDLVPLFAKLKELGMYVVGGFNENEDNSNMCQEIIYLNEAAATTAVNRRPVPTRAARPQPSSKNQSLIPLRERIAGRSQNSQQPVTRIVEPSDVETVASTASEKHSDVFSEIERLMQDFVKESEA